MALGGINAARDELANASNKYADVQKQIDRYNKVFDVFSKASPETQIRAASVMRQALNEYNSLKRQQEENALRIYEARQWVDYYNKNSPQTTQVAQSQLVQKSPLDEGNIEEVSTAPVEQVKLVKVTTPGIVNNNNVSTNAEVNAIDTNDTLEVTTPVVRTVNNMPQGVSNYIKAQTPQYKGTTISPVSKPTYTVTTVKYGPGTVAALNNTGGVATLNNSISTPSSSNKGRTIKFNQSRRIITRR